MKRNLIGVVLAAALVFAALPAQAGYYTLSPRDSVAVAKAGDTVTFDLALTPETQALAYNFWDLDFTYDAAELAFDSAVYTNGMRAFHTQDDGSGALRLAADLPFGDPDLEAAPGQTYQMASLSFSVVDVMAFDGLADLALVSQVGTEGLDLRGLFGLADTYQFGGVRGGDIGAVPVPAAVWLMGSGLIGLLGLRRRKTL